MPSASAEEVLLVAERSSGEDWRTYGRLKLSSFEELKNTHGEVELSAHAMQRHGGTVDIDRAATLSEPCRQLNRMFSTSVMHGPKRPPPSPSPSPSLPNPARHASRAQTQAVPEVGRPPAVGQGFDQAHTPPPG